MSSSAGGARKPRASCSKKAVRPRARAGTSSAIKLFEEGLALQPDVAEGYNLLGMAYRSEFARTGNAELQTREIEAFRKALELLPDYAEALLNLGQTLVNAGEKQEGVAYLEKFLEIEPDFKDRAAVEQIIQQSGTQ